MIFYPMKKLFAAIEAGFRICDNPRANVYRRDNDIPYSWGTAVTSEFDLIDASKKLGIKDAFGGESDFSTIIDYAENGLGPGDVAINAIDHQAQVKIDEKGGEAEGYTQITIGTTSPKGFPGQYLLFKLDRPFFYYISYIKDS